MGTETTTTAPATACLWCGSALDGGTVRLPGRARCPACGVDTTDPLPGKSDLEQAYGDWYRPPSGRFSLIGDALLRRSRGRLAGHLDRIAPPGAVLDVGSGDGVLLDALHARGREATGLERSSQRPDVRAGAIEDVQGSWAAVVFWHSLEHLWRPDEALRRATALLAPAGVLVVAIPNRDSLQARAFGDRWFALDIPRHLVHVPARALLAQLRDLGLEVERVSFVRGGQLVFGWLYGVVGMLPGRPDLYDAIRRPAARRRPSGTGRRMFALAAAVPLLPIAALAAAIEAALRRGGSVYVEARRA